MKPIPPLSRESFPIVAACAATGADLEIGVPKALVEGYSRAFMRFCAPVGP
jgi:hypothetical protein